MTSTPALRRCLAIGGAGAVLAALLVFLSLQRGPSGTTPKLSAEEKGAARNWPM